MSANRLSDRVYTSRLQKGGALLDDMRLLVRNWSAEANWDEQRQRFILENALGKKTKARATDILRRSFAQRFLKGDPLEAWRIVRPLEDREVSIETLRPIYYWITARGEPLLYDFVVDEMLSRSKGFELAVRVDETVSWINKRLLLQQNDSWTETVSLKVARGLLGLDFGTSNTSISYVDQLSIATYEKRTSEKTYVDLSDLIGVLPYPLAAPLSQYLAQSNPERMFQKGREFVEAVFCLGAYISYLEYCVYKEKAITRILKEFTQRSAGPLWKLLKESQRKLGDKRQLTAAYGQLIEDGFAQLMEQTVDFLAQAKHEKTDVASFDLLRPIKILANVSNEVFSKNKFGFFENVKKQKFRKDYQGLFREASGANPPFIKAYKYSGPISFSRDEAVFYSKEKGYVLNLQPLIFWDSCPNHPDLEEGHCFLFDKEIKGNFSYKAVGYPCSCEVCESNEYAELANFLKEIKNEDIRLELSDIGFLEEVEV